MGLTTSLYGEIGVIIPTKNRTEDLKECLRSLEAAAAYSKTLIVTAVIDDGSAEGSARQTVDQQQQHGHWLLLHYARNAGPPGAAGARNTGASLIRTSILAFLDDDAKVNYEWIGMVRQYCARGVALTGRICSSGQNDPFTRARQARYDARRANALAGKVVDYLAGGNCAMMRADYDEAGGFDSAFAMMHDRDLALRLIQNSVLIQYLDEMTIWHKHFKGIRSYVAMTIKSGRYRRLLEQRWPNVARWRLGDVLFSARTGKGDLGVRVVSASAEILHALGYGFERFQRRISR